MYVEYSARFTWRTKSITWPVAGVVGAGEFAIKPAMDFAAAILEMKKLPRFAGIIFPPVADVRAGFPGVPVDSERVQRARGNI